MIFRTYFPESKARLIPHISPTPIEIGSAEIRLLNGPHPRVVRTSGKLAPNTAPSTAASKHSRFLEAPHSTRPISHQQPTVPTTSPNGAAGTAANIAAIRNTVNTPAPISLGSLIALVSTTTSAPKTVPSVPQYAPPTTARNARLLASTGNTPAGGIKFERIGKEMALGVAINVGRYSAVATCRA
jgi:hypothetical protein